VYYSTLVTRKFVTTSDSVMTNQLKSFHSTVLHSLFVHTCKQRRLKPNTLTLYPACMAVCLHYYVSSLYTTCLYLLLALRCTAPTGWQLPQRNCTSDGHNCYHRSTVRLL
jgi:hypothetical protein